ncbi:phosphoglycerate mutase-like protein [Mollisia scopiformis]|uniref:Phosphoglycerate mutase-like protein n=1 Tax=Mollisia scopiformis TaxID=149040 RepID=A0A194WTB6_MOLSC|nr:phosphoglycerate mutase-like protein [Mollisia scopiformis]KUJ11205.1 phosphoglycerate mutase-like protein [Mollisia scopiformis]
MAPTIILIRHAEALHNITKDYMIRDPPLTDDGLKIQCPALSTALQALPLAQEIELIVVSPMRRTLQTTEASLGWLLNRGFPAVARAEWQENTVNNIDIGRPISELVKEYPRIDFSGVDRVFPAKEGLYEFSLESLTERGVVARKWLKERKEKVIAVVSHDGFMRVGISHRKFGNADYRIFEFEEDVNGRDGLKLVEWDLTENNGGGLGTSPKGTFGWLPHDFKYMPRPPPLSVQEELLGQAE